MALSNNSMDKDKDKDKEKRLARCGKCVNCKSSVSAAPDPPTKLAIQPGCLVRPCAALRGAPRRAHRGERLISPANALADDLPAACVPLGC